MTGGDGGRDADGVNEPGPNAPRPVLIYDGDCGFCRTWVERWRILTAGRLDCVPYQEVLLLFPGTPAERFARAVHLAEPNGDLSAGAKAVFRALSYAPGHGLGLFLYDHLPGFAPVAERAYRLVADHRSFFTRVTRLLWGASAAPSTFTISRWLFLRLLGLVYLTAFLSIAVQIEGLIGSRGILPASSFLSAVADGLGPERFYYLPTIFWLDASDAALRAVSFGGAGLALLLTAGVGTRFVLPLLWFGYLSIMTVGRDFLSFQWDVLLLESGLLAILLAPPGWRPGWNARRAPAGFPVALMQFLLFRLMFASGWVKLASGDPTWRHLAALPVHYETQPLPGPLAWYVHRLPGAFQTFSCVVMFAVELLAPLLIFAPPRARRAAFAPLVGLQVLILLTGNYAFFNGLAIALCFFLVDDAAWRRLLPVRLAEVWREVSSLPGNTGRTARGAAIVLLLTAVTVFAGQIVGWRNVPAPARSLVRLTSPFMPVGSYGLFAVMTTVRPEIVVEGSADGETWLPYEFRYKPGDPKRAPRQVAPHQPRLDWQMWFAALGGYQRTTWFEPFMARLLEGSPAVLGLLEENPFPDEPPQAVRATLFLYRFTDAKTHARHGTWWEREEVGTYAPVMRR